MSKKQSWREGAVVYQIYPRSFNDAGRSGVGNLKGVIKKLDYLKGKKDSLDVDAIWLSPIYTSPMADFGYDVADYTDIDPLFGKLTDIKKLIKQAHKRGIKVLMDLVPNHSSDEHPWFIESRSSRDNPKRDWYVWCEPAKDGGLPNNWLSIFSGPAWEYDEKTGQYYLHTFLAKQPDLNWENPEVRKAMKNVMRFWLDMGVDGFRVDAVDTLSKDPRMRQDRPNKHADSSHDPNDYFALTHTYSREGPKLFARLGEMANVLAEYDDRFMITEAHPESSNRLQGYLDYYQRINPALCAPFNFDGVFKPWEAPIYKEFIDEFQAAMKPNYTPVYAIGNHDEPRLGSRIGLENIRAAAMMLLTLPGMVLVYYGEEIGMVNVPISEAERKDPGAHRDPERTPMQWDTSRNAGFTKGKPWLPVAENYKAVNVARQTKDPKSVLSLYRQLIAIRKESDVLRKGSYEPAKSTKDIYAFKRIYNNETLLIVLNFSAKTLSYPLGSAQAEVLLATSLDQAKSGPIIGPKISLEPHEGLIINLVDSAQN